MITGIKIDEVEARKDKDVEVVGLNVNISIDAVKVSGQDVTIEFKYSADYQEGVGELKMKGSILAREDAKLAGEIKSKWDASKRLPEEFAELILNAVNYACSTNGVLVVRAINLSPPIIPPKIQMGQQAPQKK